MNYHKPLIVLATALLLGLGTTAMAATQDETASAAKEAASAAEEAERQADLEAEYKQALAEVEKQRHVAETSMAKAREQLDTASKQRERAAEESTRARAAQDAEMAKMHEELSHARRQLRETSREIARVNRDVARARASRASDEATKFIFRTSDRPVIGVILGDADDVGIKVLGVSPDGPSERAGIKQGDVIIALGGRVLAAVDETGDARNGLNIALREIKADEPVIVSVERGSETLDLTVVPEVREPLTWQTITRFPSAPHAPGQVITIEGIEIPEIDTEALAEQIEQIRIEIDERRVLMESGEFAPHDREFEFEFHELSEMGDFALHDANIWFGLPLTQGLKLAEIDPGLGEYFKTDRGVLVLKARDDNDLQLKSGDVILQVGDTDVNSPAEFMRALRDYESGQELNLNIKRDRKSRTLKAMMPERQTSFFAPEVSKSHSVRITREMD
jgi:C-terminal processing protease CtpA/Prc